MSTAARAASPETERPETERPETERYEAALEQLLEQVRENDHILAAILCGSLSHDVVWRKSDIDLVLICDDDRKTRSHGVALVVDDINIHTSVTPRDDFKKSVETTGRNTFGHSVFAKARLLYTRDPSIERLFEEILEVGRRDMQFQLLRSGTFVLGPLYKAQKWLEAKGDLDYSALWILYCANHLAEIEVGMRGEIIGREVLAQAMAHNPEFFSIVSSGLLNRKKTRKSVKAALDVIDQYLRAKTELLYQPILDYLADAGDVRSVTEIEHHFDRHHNIPSVLLALEWLSDIGVVDKASTPVKLTTRSQLEVDELAFFYSPDEE